MPVQDAGVVPVLLEFLEAFVHQVLFQRALYSSDLFDRHRLYGVAVRKARHPQLVAYVAQAVEGLKVREFQLQILITSCALFLLTQAACPQAPITAKAVEKLAVSINSPQGHCLERHIVQVRVSDEKKLGFTSTSLLIDLPRA